LEIIKVSKYLGGKSKGAQKRCWSTAYREISNERNHNSNPKNGDVPVDKKRISLGPFL